MNWLGQIVRREIEPHWTVLDLGCGNLETTGRLGIFHLAVDGFAPYLHAIKDSGPTMQGQLPGVASRFVEKSYDVVLLLDVLEHIHDWHHQELIEQAERIARKKILVYSPDGWMPQEAWDAWGMGHNLLQAHVSEVHAKTFEDRGYAISYHTSKNHHGTEGKTFLGIKNV